MIEEYLDIVDENDNVIGRDTRKAVHANYMIHRGIHIFVVNSKDQILIQKRSTNKDYYPGYYDISVGGQVSSGESYEETAKRELFEELGYQTETLEYIADYNAYSDRQREKRRIFTHQDGGPFKPSSEEIESMEFMTVDEILNLHTLRSLY